MACLQKLKDDIRLLKELFPSDHSRFQIKSASVDEINVRYLVNDQKIDVIANFQENYPRAPPIWFSESEEPVVSSVLENLTNGEVEFAILYQVTYLITQLCNFYNVPLPTEIHQIAPSEELSEEKDEGNGSDIESTGDEDMEEDMMCEMEEQDPRASRQAEEIAPEARDVLNRVTNVQRQQHLQGTATGSVTASDRLMKELKEIYRSENYKNGVYSIDLVKDNLYEWNVKLYKVDPDSPLAGDIRQLENTTKQDHILFHFIFNETFPFEPPFVRLVSPGLMNGFVLSGGALCMELLTKQGWSSAYSVESLIMQIAATLVKGKARVTFDAKISSYSLVKAQQSFKSLVQIHNKSGWFTPPKADG
ncbi:unnamed protein product [Bursaphelenchus okinawaensis]|uniref:UBC core domain-containing protein n=1 Tax=Bursaphelenchus okinawaensis TaxID=465554 RepID=A0A811JT98_9BILA|nr:unnamed protein product [Bursaphelenchus okinawaensis]CAG9082751.1 unnamed protein product [Bursaphelenchus okinawaensis]